MIELFFTVVLLTIQAVTTAYFFVYILVALLFFLVCKLVDLLTDDQAPRKEKASGKARPDQTTD